MMATKACFAQLGTKVAVKEFGQDTVTAILKEVTQLKGKKIFMACAIHELAKMKIHHSRYKKVLWTNQRKDCCRRKKTTRLHSKG